MAAKFPAQNLTRGFLVFIKMLGNLIRMDQRSTQEGGGGLQPGRTPGIGKKNTYFVDTIISSVLHDLPLSRNQPLKSADD
jgi:hypothetical protein